jgi:hypothetical protein
LSKKVNKTGITMVMIAFILFIAAQLGVCQDR